MPSVKDLIGRIESGDISYEEKLAALAQVEASLQELKAKKDERVKFNVQLIIDEIKKVKQDVQVQLDYARSIVPERGPKGDAGDRGLDGAPGQDGRNGQDGRDGKDGADGQDGVSVTDAKIDFDGSLIITLSTGREINVGEVVAADLAEKIRVTMSTNSTVTVQDEGTVITSGVRSINFTGAGVTATASGDSVTVNVAGGATNRVVSYTDATSITINADTTDMATMANTQSAGTFTLNAPTGTLVNGQKLLFRMTSTNVQTFSWNAVFRGSTDLALPTASSGAGKEDYLGFIYDSTSSKWDLIAKNFGF
jgi:hypothetical protein